VRSSPPVPPALRPALLPPRSKQPPQLLAVPPLLLAPSPSSVTSHLLLQRPSTTRDPVGSCQLTITTRRPFNHPLLSPCMHMCTCMASAYSPAHQVHTSMHTRPSLAYLLPRSPTYVTTLLLPITVYQPFAGRAYPPAPSSETPSITLALH
jgi:hypothetical protein